MEATLCCLVAKHSLGRVGLSVVACAEGPAPASGVGRQGRGLFVVGGRTGWLCSGQWRQWLLRASCQVGVFLEYQLRQLLS